MKESNRYISLKVIALLRCVRVHIKWKQTKPMREKERMMEWKKMSREDEDQSEKSNIRNIVNSNEIRAANIDVCMCDWATLEVNTMRGSRYAYAQVLAAYFYSSNTFVQGIVSKSKIVCTWLSMYFGIRVE